MRVAAGEGEGLWLRAERQTGGKGRLGREWISPPGNLYCSTIVDCRDDDPPRATLSFVSALAVFHTVSPHLTDNRPTLKWPNDLLIDGAKFCGILLETVADKVIVGIGINIASSPQVPDRDTTSLHDAGAPAILSANQLFEELSNEFAVQLGSWRSRGLQSALVEWQQYAHPKGSNLIVSDSEGGKIGGVFEGLTEDGALCLRKPDGALIEVRAGDVDLG